MNRLFIGKSDEHVHRQFVRFGKGLYDYRALINFARGKQNKVSGSFEYTNDFVLFLATIFLVFFIFLNPMFGFLRF